MDPTTPTTPPDDDQIVTAKGEEAAEALRETVVAQKEFARGAFDELLKKMSGTASEGSQPKSFRYRELTLTVPPEACRLDTFTEPFRLTLRELDAAAELRAYRAMGMKSDEGGIGAINDPETGEEEQEEAGSTAEGRGLLMALVFGREALYSINGRVFMDRYEKDFMWNSLSMAGRLAVGQEFLAAGSGLDSSVAGKISKSAAVS